MPPLLDLGAQHAPLRSEIDAAIARVIDASSFIGGSEVAAFEDEFAAFLGCRRAVGVASGTDALRLALLASDIGPGDEVITSAMSFIATVVAIIAVGATPVLVDPDPGTGLLDASSVAAAITSRTAALLPVHLYGQCVDLRAFAQLASRRGLALIEDACQAHGATRDGLVAGTVGDAAAFSFYPGKNLGALGDGGIVTTNRVELADRVARLRDHGRSDRYLHTEVGATARLDALQAAVLRIKLRHLAEWNAARRVHARAYDEAFDELRVEHVVAHAGSVYHQYVLLCDERDALAASLGERGIGTGVHYPLPLHHQPALADRVNINGSLEGAEQLAARCLSIPVYPELGEDERELVVARIAVLQSTGVS